MKRTSAVFAILFGLALSACANGVVKDVPEYVDIPSFINENTLVYTVACNSGTEKLSHYFVEPFNLAATVTLYGEVAYYAFTYPADSHRIQWFKVDANGKLIKIFLAERITDFMTKAPHLLVWERRGNNTWINGDRVVYQNNCVEKEIRKIEKK